MYYLLSSSHHHLFLPLQAAGSLKLRGERFTQGLEVTVRSGTNTRVQVSLKSGPRLFALNLGITRNTDSALGMYSNPKKLSGV